jgi:endonuclease/exonuclease/phosphatase (EEP) superfamily protein YafD
VAGDFNGHPAGPNYGSLRGLMKDAFESAGRGFGYTLTSSLPCEREDYIWSRNLKAVDCRVRPDRVSDHLPLVAWLR